MNPPAAQPIGRLIRNIASVSVVTATGIAILLHGWAPATPSASDAEKLVAKSAGSSQSGAITLEPQQSRNIATQVLAEQSVPVRLSVHGKIGFNEDQTSLVLAPISGQVSNLKVRVGDAVHKGDTLFLLKSRDVAAAKSEYLESRKDLDLAEKTYTMTQSLFNSQAASTIALQQADNDLSKARTRVVRTTEQLRVLGIDAAGLAAASDANALNQPVDALDARIAIKAALDGIVVERHVTEGQFVQGDSTPLLTIADLSSVWVMADVFERDLHLVRSGQSADVSTLAYPEDHFKASVSNISNVVDPLTRTVKVRLLVPNPGMRLKPEMFASVDLLIQQDEHALLVPSHSVLTDDGRSIVFVRLSGSRFASRDVEVQPFEADHLRVLRGLKPGDEIVTEGALLMRFEQQSADNG